MPQQARSQSTVDAILIAAGQLVMKQGVEALRMTELATVAGVSPGSLYQYFPDRETLLSTLLDRLCGQTLEQLRSIVAGHPIKSAEELLGLLAGEAIQVTLQYLPLKRALRPHHSRLAAAGELVDSAVDFARTLQAALAAFVDLPEPHLHAVSHAMVWTADGILDRLETIDIGLDADGLRLLLESAWRGLLDGARRLPVSSVREGSAPEPLTTVPTGSFS